MGRKVFLERHVDKGTVDIVVKSGRKSMVIRQFKQSDIEEAFEIAKFLLTAFHTASIEALEEGFLAAAKDK